MSRYNDFAETTEKELTKLVSISLDRINNKKTMISHVTQKTPGNTDKQTETGSSLLFSSSSNNDEGTMARSSPLNKKNNKKRISEKDPNNGEVKENNNSTSKKKWNLNTPRGGVYDQFPVKLYDMLVASEVRGFQGTISWALHGRAFKVHSPERFEKEILPIYTRQSKWTSFSRQLNLYGFQRLTRGPDTGAYYHEMFLRNKPFLCRAILRCKVKGTQLKKGIRGNAGIDLPEPDFYNNFPPLPPLSFPLSSRVPSYTNTGVEKMNQHVYDRLNDSNAVDVPQSGESKNATRIYYQVANDSNQSLRAISFHPRTYSIAGSMPASQRVQVVQQGHLISPTVASTSSNDPLVYLSTETVPVQAVTTNSWQCSPPMKLEGPSARLVARRRPPPPQDEDDKEKALPEKSKEDDKTTDPSSGHEFQIQEIIAPVIPDSNSKCNAEEVIMSSISMEVSDSSTDSTPDVQSAVDDLDFMKEIFGEIGMMDYREITVGDLNNEITTTGADSVSTEPMSPRPTNSSNSSSIEISDELLARLGTLSTHALADALQVMGWSNSRIRGAKALHTSYQKCVGRAITLQFIPTRPDIFGDKSEETKSPQDEAFEMCGPNEVLVTSSIGKCHSIKSAHLKQLATCGGLVTGGSIMGDTSDDNTNYGFPLFSYQETTERQLSTPMEPWKCNDIINAGGIAVKPGDAIIGDQDGIVCVPAKIAETIFTIAYGALES